MDWLVGVDWRKMLIPEMPLLEIVVRGSVMYLALLALLRFVLKRETAAIGITDLLVIVLIADAAQNAMADDYSSLPDGILLVGVIVFWAWFLDWLGFRLPIVQRLAKPEKLLLVRDGRMLEQNMASELLTEEELMSQLRLQGVSDLADVKVAYMEPDGRVSVITRKDPGDGAAPGRQTPARPDCRLLGLGPGGYGRSPSCTFTVRSSLPRATLTDNSSPGSR